MPYVFDHELNKVLLGIHRAIVVDRNDDSSVSSVPHRGRIKVKIPYISDGDDHKWWCDAAFPSHQFFSVPAVGTQVYVAFNSGHPEQPVWLGAVNTTNASKDPPSRFRRDTPDVSGYESLGGHFWEFDDISGERHIRIEDLNGNYFLYDTELNDLEVYFARDERRTIGRDRTTDIGRDEFITIGRDRTVDVGQDEFMDIGRDQVLDVGQDRTQRVVNNELIDIGVNQTETIGNDRTQTVVNDDSLTVQNNKTIDVTGTWDDTIQDAYSRTGQSTGTWEFQDTVSWTTQGNFEMTVQSDWTADITGNADWTITGDWTADVTQSIEFDATQNIVLTNPLFEFNLKTAVSEWKTGTTSIIVTPASITMSIGGLTWTFTASGIVTTAPSYVIAGIDVVTHKHFTTGVPPYTSTWQAGP